MSGYVDTYPQTQAQWDADTRLFNNQTVAVVTDGANIGRKKWFDGIQTFAQLDYIDAAAAGAGITSINLNTGPAIELRIPLDAMWVQINNAGAPAAGEFEASSNNDATAVTSLTFHITDAGGNDQTALFASMRIGGLLTGRQTDNDGTNTSGSPCIYRITAAPTLASSRYTIAVAHVSGGFQGSFPNWYVSYAYNAPKVYEAIMSQAGSSAPTVTVLQNDLSGPIVWTRLAPGQYDGTLSGAFTANKVARLFTSGYDSNSTYFFSVPHISANVVQIITSDDTGSLSDDLILGATIRITVYP